MNSFTSTAITGAGLAIGIALIAVEAYRWWKTGAGGAAAGGGSRDPKGLIPFGGGIGFGTLMVACPAGLLGTAAGFLHWGGNSIGDFLMSSMTGQKSSAVATGAAPALDQGGALIVTFLLRKTFAKVAKGKFWRGVFAGTLIGIGTGLFAWG